VKAAIALGKLAPKIEIGLFHLLPLECADAPQRAFWYGARASRPPRFQR
jgi:hypothetical protein